MKKRKKRRLRIILGGALLLLGLLLNPDSQWLRVGIFLVGYVAAGGDVLWKAARNIVAGQVFDENLLMSIATVGAFIIGEYPEGIAVMLFYQVGEQLQSYAVDQSRKSIAALMDIRPDYANLLRDGVLVRCDPEEVAVGERIVVKPGERVPLDGTVTSGTSMLDTTALTGESVPRYVCVGSEVLSGCINLNGLLTLEVRKEFGQSTVSKILELVEHVSEKKAKTEHFITKFAKYYTPIVVLLALMISVIPPILLADASFGDWVYRGLTFLVISCPCALVVSIPLGFFGGIGGASREGILMKGSNYLEALSQVDTVVFDKTGTLTKGVFHVQKICADHMEQAQLLALAAHAEHYSNHPIALSLKRAYGKEIDPNRIGEVAEIPGHGVRAIIDGKAVCAGTNKLMEQMKLSVEPVEEAGSIVHIAVEGVYQGYILIADAVKEDAGAAIQALRAQGIRNIVMLTGDRRGVGERIGRDLGVDQVYAELLPADKVARLEELLAQKKNPKGKLAFVGDGINDAPVLARADVGIAMGALGSDAAIEAADVVIMTDEPSKLVTGIQISRRTLGIIRQNIVFSLAIKLAVLLLAALGLANMWAGVLADVGVTVLAVLNATRALQVGKR